MKRYLKLALLSLLCALMFVVAGCDETKPSVPDNGGNNTQLPGGDTQGNTDNNNQGNTDQGGSQDNKPGGDTQGQTEEKPVKQSIYDSAKALGFTGTQADWNAQVEEAKKQDPNKTYEVDGYASIGSGKPDSTVDPDVIQYFDKTTNKLYVKYSHDFEDRFDHGQENPSSKVTIAQYICDYMLFDDGMIREVTAYCLSNGYLLGSYNDINIKDVKINLPKLNVDDTNFNDALKFVVTLENLEKFEIPVRDSRIVISNTVRPVVGTYEVHAKVNNKEYNFSVKVSNEVTIYISDVRMQRDEAILVVDEGNGKYDYKLTDRNLDITYNNGRYVKQKPISRTMIKHIPLSKGVNYGTIYFEGYSIPVTILVATPDEIRNATNVKNVNSDKDFIEEYNNIQIEHYAELNTEFICEKHLKYNMTINGINAYVCDRITGENLIGFDSTKEGRDFYTITYYGHDSTIKIPVTVRSLANVNPNHISTHNCILVGEDIDDLILSLYFEDANGRYRITKKLKDYTKSNIITNTPGVYSYEVNFNGYISGVNQSVLDDSYRIYNVSIEFNYGIVQYLDSYDWTVFDGKDSSIRYKDIYLSDTNLEYDSTIKNKEQIATCTIFGQKVLMPLLDTGGYGYNWLDSYFVITQHQDTTNLEKSLSNNYGYLHGEKFNYSIDMFDLKDFNPNQVGRYYTTYTYKGVTKNVIIEVQPDQNSGVKPVLSLDGKTNVGNQKLEIYDNYVKFINFYYSDFTYDKANGILIIRGYDTNTNILGKRNSELWIKVNEAAGTYELAPLYNEQPLNVYKGYIYNSTVTLKIYSNNRYEMIDETSNITFSGKYDTLTNGIIECGFYVKTYEDGTMSIC